MDSFFILFSPLLNGTEVRRQGDVQRLSPTLTRLITFLTPPVSRAKRSAFVRVSAFLTRPWSVTTPSWVSTVMLNGLRSPSVASFAFTFVVMDASSAGSLTAWVVLHADKSRANTSARRKAGTRIEFLVPFLTVDSPSPRHSVPRVQS